MFDQAKCRIGVHAGSWVASSDGSCDTTRTCTRCSKVKHKVTHTFGSWEPVVEGSCKKRRTCRVCGFAKTDVFHQYGDPVYRNEHSCAVVHICQRCGHQRPDLHLSHQYAQRYIGDNIDKLDFQARQRLDELDRGWQCETTLICLRCHDLEDSDEIRILAKHRYGDWVPDNTGRPIRICRRCGDREVRSS